MHVASLALMASVLLGNPQGSTIVSGAITINTAGKVMTVRQTTDRGIINWNRFENTASETINFQQPTSASLTLNRVVGVDPSSIAGALNANGRVFLLNPNGIVFGPTARVNVGSIVASTLAISDSDFQNNANFRVVQTTNAELGAVVNQGNITATEGGLVALVAPIVSNDGTVVAAAGRVFLVGSTDATVAFDPHTVTNNVNVVPTTPGRIPTIGLSPLLEGVINVVSIASPVGAARVERLTDGTVFLRGAAGIAVNGGTIDTRGTAAGQVRVEGINSVALGAGSKIEGGTGQVAIKAVKGDVVQFRLDGATPTPTVVRGNDIIVNADEGRIRTTDDRHFQFEAINKVTLNARDRVGRTGAKLQVKAARVEAVAARGEVGLFVDGDIIADKVNALVNEAVTVPITLDFVSSGSVFGGTGFVNLDGFRARIDIAGDAGSLTQNLSIGSGGGRQVNLTVAGQSFFPPFSVGQALKPRLTTQDQFNTTAANQTPASRSTYTPPVDVADPVAPAPSTPVVVTPGTQVADNTPVSQPQSSSGNTVGQADNVLLPALRTDRGRNADSGGGAGSTVADASGGLSDVSSEAPAATELDGSASGAVAGAPRGPNDDRVAQLRRKGNPPSTAR